MSGWRRPSAPQVEAPVLLHPDDLPLWRQTHDAPPDGELADGQQIEVGGTTLTVLHTPGHAPGAVCFYARTWPRCSPATRLFYGGPGATGRSFSDRPLLITSITDKLLTLPGQTVVKTGHGDDTTIADEKDNLV